MHWLGYDRVPARPILARKEAEAALRLAPDLPQAHWAMGMAYYFGERDYGRALEELTAAVERLRWLLIGGIYIHIPTLCHSYLYHLTSATYLSLTRITIMIQLVQLSA
jgi:hypothetical protein